MIRSPKSSADSTLQSVNNLKLHVDQSCPLSFAQSKVYANVGEENFPEF